MARARTLPAEHRRAIAAGVSAYWRGRKRGPQTEAHRSKIAQAILSPASARTVFCSRSSRCSRRVAVPRYAPRS